MSVALWCDQGSHAFGSKDPYRQHFTQTRTVHQRTGNSYGRDVYQDQEMVADEFDICGPCGAKSGLFPEVTPQELAAPKHEYDPTYTARLEREIDEK